MAARPHSGDSAVDASFQQKGFVALHHRGVEVIIPPLITVPAGAFLMGSDKQRDGRATRAELPQQIVTLEAFEIATYPLTVAEYADFLQATNHAAPEEWGNQQHRPDHPVVYVSWMDVLAYAQWLAQVTGYSWRLPSEAEWEKAARGTDGRIYPWGDDWDKTRANTRDGGPGTTTPVGSYPSGMSPFGGQDMAGNVWEWTSTTYKSYPYQASDGREDHHPATTKVLRGGSWYSDPESTRSAFRVINAPSLIFGSIGARLICIRRADENV